MIDRDRGWAIDLNYFFNSATNFEQLKFKLLAFI